MRRDLIALPDHSKVWIYQSTIRISDHLLADIQNEVIGFTKEWTSHGRAVESYGHIFHHRFLVFVADETNHVSGCSIDSSVRFIQNLGTKYNLDFFDRLNFLYFNNENIESIHHSDFAKAIETEVINEDYLIFNNLVKTKKEFIQHWIVPIKFSWHKKYLPVTAS